LLAVDELLQGWRSLTVDQGMQGMEMEEVQPIH
jgi:hypothetical protein